MMTAAHLETLKAKPENRILLAWNGFGQLVMPTTEDSLPYLLAACHGQEVTPLAIVRAKRP